ncbi:MAG: choice-of-anchor tandem repeat GloVer-containing protein [Bryobacteraceae bacterium]|jgi:uncharacterized repeat protein (TIGR03803 family)
MKNTRQQLRWISTMGLAGASAALVLATVLVLAVITTPAAQAQTFSVLYDFDNFEPDGFRSYAGLVQGIDGTLYGTTWVGGANDYGSVFKITPSGTLTTLHSFDNTDGANPDATLMQAANGDFYGTTPGGGANGEGTVFKITPSGTFTTLYNFCSQTNCTDGESPSAGLVQATNGELYGTTRFGGAYDCGTVFNINAAGTLTTLHSFDNTDGYTPAGTLIQATNGDLYGTTVSSGAYGDGTVFKMTPSGTLTTLHSFGYTDGANPVAGVIQATNFYGTTAGGGGSGDGTVFKMTPSGTLTTLHSFDNTDGANPHAGLVQATDGNFYGTTELGGANTSGTIFKITAGGTLTTLYSFCPKSGCPDGAEPYAGLVQATNGTFYGTTYQGASADCFDGCGDVFSLSVGLGPFVETQTTSGKVGAAVKILGTNLTGATSVTFNGTAATFTVVSKSEITTTVPTGATTGPVEVTVSGHTLKSNTKFRVTP